MVQGLRHDSKEILDLNSAISAMLNIILSSESYSPSRQCVLLLSSEVVAGFCSSALLSSTNKTLLSKDCSRLSTLIYRLNALASLPKHFKSVFETTFLYHHIDILSPMISSIYEKVTLLFYTSHFYFHFCIYFFMFLYNHFFTFIFIFIYIFVFLFAFVFVYVFVLLQCQFSY